MLLVGCQFPQDITPNDSLPNVEGKKKPQRHTEGRNNCIL